MMSILNNKLYISDINKSLSTIDLTFLKDKSVLVTGSSGLVCSTIIDLLLLSKIDVEIYAVGRDESKIKDRFNGMVKFIEYDVTKPISFDVDVDYIIHGASNASPNLYINCPVDTMLTNFIGMNNLMEYAKNHKTKKVLYVSSSEVYGSKDTLEPFVENQYGYIDLLNPRSSYSISKRATETLCECYRKQYDIDYCVARLGHIYGPSASKNDKRVSSDFIYQVANGKDLVLKSKGEQLRSYCYSVDCANAILSILKDGVSGEAYNISNKNSIISIRDMAQILANCGNVNLSFDLPNVEDEKAFNPMDNSSLNSEKLELLGWNGLFDANVGFSHSLEIIKEVNNA